MDIFLQTMDKFIPGFSSMAIKPFWGAIAGAVIGLAGSSRSSKSASRAADRQAEANERALELQEKQYADWEEVYGPIRKTLGDYYEGLSSSSFAAKNIQNLQETYDNFEIERDRKREQTGLTRGAISALDEQAQFNLASGKASIRTEAPLQLAQAKQGFLTNQISNTATTGLTNALNNQAAQYGNRAQQQSSQANQWASLAGKFGAQAFSQWGDNTATDNSFNNPFTNNVNGGYWDEQ